MNQLKEEFKNVSGKRLPLQSDMFEAADAILQIHFMYNLNAKDVRKQNVAGRHACSRGKDNFNLNCSRPKWNEYFLLLQLARGLIKGKYTGVTLVALDCLFIGFVAKFNRKNTLAIDWLMEAIRLAIIDGTVGVSTVRAMLMDTIKQVKSKTVRIQRLSCQPRVYNFSISTAQLGKGKSRLFLLQLIHEARQVWRVTLRAENFQSKGRSGRKVCREGTKRFLLAHEYVESLRGKVSL